MVDISKLESKVKKSAGKAFGVYVVVLKANNGKDSLYHLWSGISEDYKSALQQAAYVTSCKTGKEGWIAVMFDTIPWSNLIEQMDIFLDKTNDVNKMFGVDKELEKIEKEIIKHRPVNSVKNDIMKAIVEHKDRKLLNKHAKLFSRPEMMFLEDVFKVKKTSKKAKKT